jgi:hypothetical protein
MSMKIGEKLRKKLSKKFEPGQMLHQKFGRYDISFKTDEEGNAISLFVGKRNAEGNIQGERFVRILTRDINGKVLKDHWDGKGRT